MSQIYNEYLEKYIDEDYVVFIHDDVEIHDRFLYKKIKSAHKTYDVVGLAGGTSQNYTNMKFGPAWHLCMDDSRKHGRGFVSHYIPPDVGGYDFPYINSSYFGPSPSEVVFVDGLMMSFNMETYRRKPIKFKEKYTFHMYDMSACVELKKAEYKIGVYPIFVIHHGLGDFTKDPLWKTLSTEFIKDYSDYSISI